MHPQSHPLADQFVKIKDSAKHPQVPDFGGSHFHLEDWWDRVYGKSWTVSDGVPAAMIYAFRCGLQIRESGGFPADDEVVYGKIGKFGHLVHVKELDVQDHQS